MTKKCPKCKNSFKDTASFCPHDGMSLVPEQETEIKPEDFVGKVLDSKYQIQHLIGEGGMGNVYQAKHLHIGFPVAVKILHPKLTKDPTAVERFRREARSAITIAHPNAVQVMDFGITSDNILYLVMELIEGVSLQKVLEKEKVLTAARAISMMKQVCLAVDAAHKKSIIHRDLKPDNILILETGTPSESAKVIDFSIAKIKQGIDDPSITTAGIAVGTPKYISPEQAQGLKETDHRADIYSLGAILYQMLTGIVPFQGKTPAMILIQHINAAPKPPREINPAITVALEKIILRALAKAPSSRQQSAAEFAEELELALNNSDSFATKLDVAAVTNKVESSPSTNESDIATKLALPAVTVKKTIGAVAKTTNSKEAFQKSGKLLTDDKDNILPSFQPEPPKKTFWQWLFSWFTFIFNHQ